MSEQYDNPFEKLRPTGQAHRKRPRAPYLAPVNTPPAEASVPAVSVQTPDQGLGGLTLFQQEAPSWSQGGVQSRTHELLDLGISEVDWQLVRTMVEEVGRRLEKRLVETIRDFDGNVGSVPVEQREELAQPLIHQVVRVQSDAATTQSRQWSAGTEKAYVDAVQASMFGLGRWQPLLEIPDAENIVISGADEVWVDHADGRRTFLPPVADSNEELLEQISRLAENSTPKRAFDTMHTDVTINYRDKFRIHAMSDEISRCPSVAIRQHLHTKIGLGDMVDQGMMSRQVAEFLAKAVALKLSIIVVGDVGDGKTTLLRALIDAIPHLERFATLETDLELYAHLMPGRKHTLVLTARDGMGERNADGSLAGEIRVAELIPPTLRQMISRIIVGELRGDEAAALFEAMQTASGSMATLHARDITYAAGRLATLGARSSVLNLAQAQREVGDAVDLVVEVKKIDTPEGRRRLITNIVTMQNGDEGPNLGQVLAIDPYTGQQLHPLSTAGVPKAYLLDTMQVSLNRYENASEEESA